MVHDVSIWIRIALIGKLCWRAIRNDELENCVAIFGKRLGLTTVPQLRESEQVAGQICVLRRITMLKQGSLVPRSTLLRWGGLLTIVTAMSVVPLSGLRGIPSETDKAKSDVAAEDTKTVENAVANETETQQAKMAEHSIKMKEIHKKYPPLCFMGPMVYRPGRFMYDELGAAIGWYHDFYMISFFGQLLPEQAELFGQAGVHLTWLELDRSKVWPK